MRGDSAAFTTAVEVRSYSPMSGDTAAEVVIHWPAQFLASASATASSWRSSRKAVHQRHGHGVDAFRFKERDDIVETAKIEGLMLRAVGIDAAGTERRK